MTNSVTIRQADERHKASLEACFDELQSFELSIEANRAEREEQLAQAKMTFDDYLKRVGKTKEEYEKEERSHIERQFKTRFIFREIAKKENFIPDPKRVEENVAALMKQHADSDPARVRSYVENMLANEEVLKLLEGNPEKKD